MKILRARKDGQVFYAEVFGNILRQIEGLPYENVLFTGNEYKMDDDIEVLTPSEPSKIVAVGLNYEKHAGELKEKMVDNPIIFLKPSTSVVASQQEIRYPSMAGRVDYEAELAVVISKECRDVSIGSALDYVFGYTVLNDVTARDLQSHDGQWTRAKSFDTFCPFGPIIDTSFNPSNKRVRSVLNGAIKQDGNTDDMRHGVPELISFISSCMTLLPGDVIATGTPEGIGPMQKGDTIQIMIDGLQTLENTVI